MKSKLSKLLLDLDDETNYSKWKKRRNTIINQIKNDILKSSEHEIIDFYASLELEIKNTITASYQEHSIHYNSTHPKYIPIQNSKQNNYNSVIIPTTTNTRHNQFYLSNVKPTEISTIIRAFLELSVLYFFQRNLDFIQSYYQIINKFFKSNNRLIIKSIVMTYSWIALDSNEPTFVFKGPFKKAKKWLRNYSKNCLISQNTNRNFTGVSTNQISKNNSYDNYHSSFFFKKRDQISTQKVSSLGKVKDQKSNHFIYNSLLILNKLRHFPQAELVQVIFDYSDLLYTVATAGIFPIDFNFFNSDDKEIDMECQHISLQLLLFEINQICECLPQSSCNTFMETISDCCQTLLKRIQANYIDKNERIPDKILNSLNTSLKLYSHIANYHQYMKLLNNIDVNLIANLIQLTKNEQIFKKGIKILIKLLPMNNNIAEIIDLIIENYENTARSYSLLSKAIDNSTLDHQLMNQIINFLFDRMLLRTPQTTINDQCQCPFYILSKIMKISPNFVSNNNNELKKRRNQYLFRLNEFKYLCNQYIKCAKLNPDFFIIDPLKTFIAKLYKIDPFTEIDITERHFYIINITNTLKLYSIITSAFPPEIELLSFFHKLLNSRFLLVDQSITEKYNENKDIKKDDLTLRLYKRVAKVMSVMNDPKAIDILLYLALFGYNKYIRRKCIQLLKPSPYLSTHFEIVNLLNDPSSRNQIIAIKLISCLSLLNPLVIRPAIFEYIQTILYSLISSNNSKMCAKYSKILDVITKHFDKSSNVLHEQIIIVALRAITSTIHIKEYHQLTYEDDNSTKVSSYSSYCSANSITTNISNDFCLSHSENGHLSVSYLQKFPYISQINDKLNIFSRYSVSVLQMPPLILTGKQALKEPNKAKLYLLMNSEYVDIRDAHLLKVFAHMGILCQKYLNEILDCYAFIFENRRSNKELLIIAAKSLTKLSLISYNGLNIRLRCPQLIQPLFNLLSISTTTIPLNLISSTKLSSKKPLTKLNKDVNSTLPVVLIQLLGSAFDSLDIMPPSQSGLIFSENYTEFVILTILNSAEDVSLTMLRTLTYIVENDPLNSCKFLPKIISLFIFMLKKASPIVLNELFKFLEIIVYKCKIDFVPFLPKLTQILKSYLDITSCVHCCMTMSYFLNDNFLIANDLYISCIDNLQTNDFIYFQVLLKLIASMIIYQDTAFIMFLRAIQNIQCQPQFMESIVFNLISIIQSIDISMFSSLLVSFGVRALNLYNIDMTDYFTALLIYGQFSLPILNLLFETNHLTKQIQLNEDEILHSSQNKFEFLNKYKLELEAPKLSMNLNNEKVDIFVSKEVNEPPFDLWLRDLLQYSIINSPIPAIRACSGYLSLRNSKVATCIFDAAVSSFWIVLDEKPKIEQLVNRFIDVVSTNDLLPALIKIVELSDKVLMPMNVNMKKLAYLNQTNHYSLFIIQRALIHEKIKAYKTQFNQNPDAQLGQNDMNSTKIFIDICLKLGKVSTARALLYENVNQMTDDEIAQISFDLGDWTKSLEIYKAKNDILKIIQCLEKLYRYDDVLKYQPLILQYIKENSPQIKSNTQLLKEVIKSSESFLFPLYFTKQYDQIGLILAYIYEHFGWSSFSLQFAIFFAIETGHSDYAQELINFGFERLAEPSNRNKLLSCDHILIEEIESEAQILVESQEVLRHKQNKTERSMMESLWKRRIKYFKKSKNIWNWTIHLRNLIIPICSNLDFYLKFISELRKTQNFALIDMHFLKPMNMSMDARVILEHIKILWARNNKESAYKAATYLSIEMNKDLTFEEYHNYSQKYNFQFPHRFVFYLTKTEKFNEALKNYCFDKFRIDQMDDLINYLMDLDENKLRDLIKELFSQFPKDLYDCEIEFKKKFFYNQFDDPSFDLPLYHSSVLRLAGFYISLQKYNSLKQFQNAELLFQEAIKIKPDSRKSWRQWAYCNATMFRRSQFMSNIEKTPNDYAKNAIDAFMNLLQLSTEDSLEYLCQVVSIIKQSSHISQTSFDSIPASSLILILPQLTADIDHYDQNVRTLIYNALTRCANEYFEDVYYALSFYSHFDNEKGTIANDLIKQFISIDNRNLEIAEDANLFIDGMVRSANTWFEIWKYDIENVLKNNQLNMKDTILKLTHMKPVCELDEVFLKIYKDTIYSILLLLNNQTEESNKLAWAKIQFLYSSLKDKIRKLSLILLQKISAPLCVKSNFEIDVPGFKGDRIKSIRPSLEVIETQKHPRILFINGVSGVSYQFLLKGKEDLRVDQSIMQLFSLMNGIFQHDIVSRESNLTIQRYIVVPLTKDAGLIQWVTGTDTMHRLITEYRRQKGIPLDRELSAIRQFIDCTYMNLNHLQKLELFETLTGTYPQCSLKNSTPILPLTQDELFHSFWSKSPNSSAWIDRIQRFTTSYAVMAMAGYIIGLGDRHPSNIMIQRETGSVVHIDFGETFDKARYRTRYPEYVPFRLTKMIVNAIEGGVSNGFFREMCEKTMHVFRSNEASLKAQLSIFFELEIDSSNDKRSNGRVFRAINKLIGVEFKEKTQMNDDFRRGLTIGEQVQYLIQTAEDPANYTKHFQGWCPFW